MGDNKDTCHREMGDNKDTWHREMGDNKDTCRREMGDNKVKWEMIKKWYRDTGMKEKEMNEN